MIDPLTRVANFSRIQIRLKPGVDLDMVRDLLRAAFPAARELFRRFMARSGKPVVGHDPRGDGILNVLLFLIIAVAGFGILAIFFMIVVEKTRDIGILKSLGASRRGIMSIFLGYGFSLGIVGASMGLGLGLLIVRYISEIADTLGRLTGQPFFDPTVYAFQKIPAIIQWPTIATIIVGALLIAVLASILPARAPRGSILLRLCAMSEVHSFDPWTNGSMPGVPLASPVPTRTVGSALAEPSAPKPFAFPSHGQNIAREILAAHYIRKSYRKASMEIPVLQGVELTIREGEFVADRSAPAAVARRTLLHVLATLDAPDSGEVCFEGNRIDNLPAAGRDILRNRYFGMVFQFYHLLPELTTIENVLDPAMIGQSVLGYLASPP